MRIKYNLIHMINMPKKYPISQIYSALSQMIDNKEYLIDKYGRSGYLVNIGQYYLFQPIELNNKNIAIFDRNVPIDYKHSTIQFDIKIKEGEKEKEREKDREKERKSDRVASPRVASPRKSNEFQDNGLHLINQLLLDYLKAKKGVSLKARQKDIDWYEQCGITITNMKNDIVKELGKKYELNDEQLKKNVAVIREIQQFDKIMDTILIEHIVDTQDFNNKLLLYQYLYSVRERAI